MLWNFKRELYKFSFIFRFWTYSQHHKFLNILYSFLGKEGKAKTFEILTTFSFSEQPKLSKCCPIREIWLLNSTWLLQFSNKTGILWLSVNSAISFSNQVKAVFMVLGFAFTKSTAFPSFYWSFSSWTNFCAGIELLNNSVYMNIYLCKKIYAMQNIIVLKKIRLEKYTPEY